MNCFVSIGVVQLDGELIPLGPLGKGHGGRRRRGSRDIGMDG